jgi:hypothetical protein
LADQYGRRGECSGSASGYISKRANLYVDGGEGKPFSEISGSGYKDVVSAEKGQGDKSKSSEVFAMDAGGV